MQNYDCWNMMTECQLYLNNFVNVSEIIVTVKET